MLVEVQCFDLCLQENMIYMCPQLLAQSISQDMKLYCKVGFNAVIEDDDAKLLEVHREWLINVER